MSVPPGEPAPIQGPPQFTHAPGPVFAPFLPPAPPPVRPRRTWPGIVALALAGALVVAVSVQVAQVNKLQKQAAAAETQGRAATARADALALKIKALELRAGQTIDTAQVAKSARPSVFTVVAGNSLGTAFAFGKPAAGGGTYLLTNYHVVADEVDKGVSDVKLERKDETYPAKILKTNKDDDLALLLTTEVFPKLETLGTDVTPGEPVVVVGSPKGLTDSVTSGVVSALRTLPGDKNPMVQFDAAINPGNSGGPVIDKDVKVIGIATAKLTNAEGIGLAIPISLACTDFSLC